MKNESIFDCPKNIVLNELDITEAQFNERRLPYDVNKSYLAVYRYIKQSVRSTQLSIDSQTIGYNIHNLSSLPKVIKEYQSLESFFIKDVNLIALGQDFNRLRAVREISVTNVPLNFLPAQTIYLDTMILDHTALTENDIAHLLNTQNIVFLYKTDDKSISRDAPNAAVLEQDLDLQGNVIVPVQPQQAPPVNPRARDGCDCLTAGLLLIFAAMGGRYFCRKVNEARYFGWKGLYL